MTYAKSEPKPNTFAWVSSHIFPKTCSNNESIYNFSLVAVLYYGYVTLGKYLWQELFKSPQALIPFFWYPLYKMWELNLSPPAKKGRGLLLSNMNHKINKERGKSLKHCFLWQSVRISKSYSKMIPTRSINFKNCLIAYHFRKPSFE